MYIHTRVVHTHSTNTAVLAVPRLLHTTTPRHSTALRQHVHYTLRVHVALCLCMSTRTPRIHSTRYSSGCGPTSRDSLCLVRSMPCTPTHTLRHAQRCSRACIACWEHGTVCPRYRGSSTSSLLRHVVLQKTSTALHTTSACTSVLHADMLLHPL